MHEAYPESAEHWRARGDRVELLPVDEAMRRWNEMMRQWKAATAAAPRPDAEPRRDT